MSVKHSTLLGSALHQPFRKGTEAQKPASPSIGDWYWATDTDKLYKCLSAGVWTEFKAGVANGNDASKPASCAVGDMYLATDKQILYICYSTNVWSIHSAFKTATFVNTNLVAGKLIVTHSWGLSSPYLVIVEVFDNNNKKIIPDDITGSANSVEIDLTSYGTISGTWQYRVKL